MLTFVTRCIFSRYGCLRAIISDGGSDFNNVHFRALFKKYGVQHRVITPYQPLENGQVEVSNKEVKSIVKKVIDQMGRIGHTSFSKHYGHTERHTRNPLGCLPSGLSTRKPAIFRLSLSIEPIGPSNSSTYL